MSIMRFLQPNVVKNEKYANYNISQLSSDQAKNILSSNFIDGVFGIEAYRISNKHGLIFFSPPHYQFEGNEVKFNSTYYVISNKDNTTYAQLFLYKSSMFPIEMNCTESFWELLKSIIPSHINIKYQLLLVYRQDNWRDRIIEQYDDYLNGVQSPSDSGIFRKIQRSITEKMDELLNWEQRHSEIIEVEQKVKENGYRFTIRFALIGGTKKEREILVNKVEVKINEFSYMNKWIVDAKLNFDDVSELYNKRKLDYSSKNCVLSTSEVLPFIITIALQTEECKTEISISKNTTETKQPIQTEDYSLIKLLPKGNDIEQFDGTDLANKFLVAIKELRSFRGSMELINFQSGSTTVKIIFSLPKQLKFSEINKSSVVNDIQMKMGVKQLQIKQGDNVGEIDVIIPLEKRQKVFLGNYIDTDEFREYASNHPLPFLVGVDEIGSPLYSCMSKIKHLLVAGSTGSGKSVWLNQLILTLLMTKNPSELQMFMIDIKQVELVQFSKFNHVQSVTTDADEAITVLKQLINEMNRRYELFKNAEVKNIGLYNKKSKTKLPYILCVIDEYAELTIRNEDVHTYIQSLTQLSRACGIHLIIATQRPSVDVISGTIKSNLPSKIGFRCANTRSYLTFLNTKPKFDLLGNGDGIMSFEGQSEEHIRFQGCLILDDQNDENLEEKLIKKIARNTKSERINIELPEIEEVEEERELDRLKRVIATTGETRVSPLRNMMKININKLNDLMKDLVDDGWLEAPKTKQSGYKLILNEEELEEWKKY